MDHFNFTVGVGAEFGNIDKITLRKAGVWFPWQQYNHMFHFMHMTKILNLKTDIASAGEGGGKVDAG